MPEYSITVDRDRPLAEVVLAGEIDLSAAQALRNDVGTVVAAARVEVRLDLGAVSLMDRSGLGAMLDVRARAGEQGKRLLLAGVPVRVRRLFELAELDHVFDLVEPD